MEIEVDLAETVVGINHKLPVLDEKSRWFLYFKPGSDQLNITDED